MKPRNLLVATLVISSINLAITIVAVSQAQISYAELKDKFDASTGGKLTQSVLGFFGLGKK